MKRVVITGLGALTPIGNDVDSFYKSLIDGKSGIDYITRFDTKDFPTKIAGEIKNFDPSNFLEKKEIRRNDTYVHYAVAVGDEALKDSGLNNKIYPPEKIGIIWGSGIGGIATFEEQTRTFVTQGVNRVSPFFITMMISNMASGYLAIRYGFKGDNYAVVSACASGSHAIGSAFIAIRSGRLSAVLAGGSESPIVPIALAGFCANRALSTRNDNPQKASRPFDTERDGFVIGEGAGALVLEELESAQKRGAKIYAEILGVGMSADAFHITAPPENGEGAYLSMDNGIKDANLKSSDIDYINVHGTSTLAGDLAELRAIIRLFDNKEDKIKISSNKSMIGHLLGAAGAVEAIATIKTINNGIIPPTINIENPEPETESVNIVPNVAINYPVKCAISNSFGFGGHNVSLVFSVFNQ